MESQVLHSLRARCPAHKVAGMLLALSLVACAGVGGGSGVGGNGGSGAISSVPAAPRLLSVLYTSPKEFSFVWYFSASATTYKILEDEDGDGPGGFVEVGGMLASSPSEGYRVMSGRRTMEVEHIEVTTLLHRKRNARYAVQACNDLGCSTPSNVRTVDVNQAIGYFKASNAGFNDNFGSSIALSADGTTLAIGASGESSNAKGVGGDQGNNSSARSGAVYVFTRRGKYWEQQAYLKASNTGAGDRFGLAVGLSADGNTLAVGAPFEATYSTGVDLAQNNDAAPDSGAVYVFKRSGTAWSQQAYVKSTNTDVEDQFGISIALSGDGNTLAVGAIQEDSSAGGINGASDEALANSGAVYVYVRNASVWSPQAFVKASNPGSNDFFGSSLALSADGNTLAVGAEGEDSAAVGVNGSQTDESARNAGVTYVFSRSGSAWSQQAYVKASNTGTGDRFGVGVTMSADGHTLAVGARGEGSNATGVNGDPSNDLASESGAVYVYARTGKSWAQRAYIKASNTKAGDNFGDHVALSGDGNTLAVLAPEKSRGATGISGNELDNSVINAGAVYLFSRTGPQWVQQTYLKPMNKAASVDLFSIALSADGNTLAYGDINDPNVAINQWFDMAATGKTRPKTSKSAPGSGAVFVY